RADSPLPFHCLCVDFEAGMSLLIPAKTCLVVPRNFSGPSPAFRLDQMLPMRRAAVFVFSLCLAVALTAKAQVAESANARQFNVTAGGFASAFNPNDGSHPPYGAGTNHLVGLGTYVD